jgi:hypothetical protein
MAQRKRLYASIEDVDALLPAPAPRKLKAARLATIQDVFDRSHRTLTTVQFLKDMKATALLYTPKTEQEAEHAVICKPLSFEGVSCVNLQLVNWNMCAKPGSDVSVLRQLLHLMENHAAVRRIYVVCVGVVTSLVTVALQLFMLEESEFAGSWHALLAQFLRAHTPQLSTDYQFMKLCLERGASLVTPVYHLDMSKVRCDNSTASRGRSSASKRKPDSDLGGVNFMCMLALNQDHASMDWLLMQPGATLLIKDTPPKPMLCPLKVAIRLVSLDTVTMLYSKGHLHNIDLAAVYQSADDENGKPMSVLQYAAHFRTPREDESVEPCVTAYVEKRAEILQLIEDAHQARQAYMLSCVEEPLIPDIASIVMQFLQ